MKKEKKGILFFKIKVSITTFLTSVILFAFLGYYLANIQTEKKEKIDLSQMDKILNILDKEFLDVRTTEEKKEDSPEDRKWGILSGLVASFKDPYTIFLPPTDSKFLNEEISGEFGGVGIEIENRSGFLTIVSPLPGTPAAKAGLRPKDVIVEVDGEESINISASKAAKLIRGEPGTKVVLTIARKGNPDVIKIEVERAIIKIPTIKTYKQDGVFVIKIYSFTDKIPELFFEAIKEFSQTGYDKLLIDLRGNPGGHLFAAIYIAGMFLPEGADIITEKYLNSEETLKSGEYHKNSRTINIFSQRVKIGILVDGGSASASEIFAGALRDNNRAILLGENTYGKGTVQKIEEFADGSMLKYTVAKFILPSGEWISHKGIPVDVEIKISEEELKKSREKGLFDDQIDPQMLRAIKELQKYKTQTDIIKRIEKTKEELKEKAKKEREEKLKKILENKNDLED